MSGRKTKIIATIGPAWASRAQIINLLNAGVDVARINCSHTDGEGIRATVQLLRDAAAEKNHLLGILLDLAGPKFRVVDVSAEGRKLQVGERITIGFSPDSELQIAPKTDFGEVEDGARIMLDDGNLVLCVVGKGSKEQLTVEVVVGGLLLPRKGVNFPGIALQVPALTAKDKEDLRTGLAAEVDWVALSFVRNSSDREPIDQIFKSVGRRIPVMAKIEKPEAVHNLDAIIQSFEGVMVARGDLGVEMPPEQVPLIQKEIIRKCNLAGKPVVTATQLMASMVTNPAPTRAEVNDVANAVLDGADALMLSNETAVGQYPAEAVRMMGIIAQNADANLNPLYVQRRSDYLKRGVETAISHAAVTIARDCRIRAIVTMTHSGITARGISHFRPEADIYAMSPKLDTCRQLAMVWGVVSLLVDDFSNTDEMIAAAEKRLLQEQAIQPGDLFVFTAGIPIGQAGTTNLLKVQLTGKGG